MACADPRPPSVLTNCKHLHGRICRSVCPSAHSGLSFAGVPGCPMLPIELCSWVGGALLSRREGNLPQIQSIMTHLSSRVSTAFKSCLTAYRFPLAVSCERARYRRHTESTLRYERLFKCWTCPRQLFGAGYDPLVCLDNHSNFRIACDISC